MQIHVEARHLNFSKRATFEETILLEHRVDFNIVYLTAPAVA